MSVSLANGRDPTPAFLEEVPDYDAPLYGTINVDVAEATAWAKANGVSATGPGSVIGRINTARFNAGLPGFNILPSKAMQPAPASRPIQRAVPAPAPPPPATDPTRYFDPSLRVIQTEDELLGLVVSYNGTISALCTPELAGWLLALNTGNRPKHDRNVDRFCEIIRSGAWMLTGEPVIIAKEGLLNDGQHRLDAVRTTGIAVPMDLRFGVNRAAFEATGTGARRTLGNVLAIAGHQNSTLLAAVARLLHHYDCRTMASSTQQVEARLLLAIIDGEPTLPPVVSWITKCKFKPLRVSPFGLVMVVAARAVGLERVTSFAETVASGQAGDNDPARRLHVRLRDAALNRERLHQSEIAALGIRAWNYWVQGRPMQQLRISEADRTSLGFPLAADPSAAAPGGAG